ncbi:formylglycine-generating enzyme family protein [Neolewinella persica]|uniref:formylglycine-generating enzyme family protein n=1 Tax=Neolewinella persica TaxID=70998 RepID=UPI0005C789D7|nr:formylglycine-generating enzyme family protein [Neolewinella persica]
MRILPGAENFPIGNNKGEEDSYEDEQPRHSRSIAPFALAEYPVTQTLWTAVYNLAEERNLKFDDDLLRPNPSNFLGPNRPVEKVSWNDAHEFCRILNLLCGKPEKYFRLPSEAEWEYAARAGKRETLYAGSNQLNEVGWYGENNKKETMPVGLLTPNVFGLYDLSGNVFEWCEDDWHGNYENHPSDGQAWIDDPEKRASIRVRRGGSWYNLARYCRCALRIGNGPDLRDRVYGFRLAAPVQ